MSPLISAAELASQLGQGDLVVVDCRFKLTQPTAGHEAYLAGHIPGARYADLDLDLARPPSAAEGRHPLPDPVAFAQTLGLWGIGNDSRVVVYDDQSGAIAARLWWMLRWLGHDAVTVLDGGLQAWTAEGGALEPGEAPAPRPRRFAVSTVHADWIATADELAQLDGRLGPRLLDARAPTRFAGHQEPIDPVAGHVPGALNWPFSGNLEPSGRLRAPDQIASSLAQLGIGPHDPLVAMCGSGVTACHLLLALATLGRPGRLYVGSWSEWIRDPDRPIATS